jgi:hypothetical protein
LEELGISIKASPAGIFFGSKDYTAYALEVLVRKGIILRREDGKIWLSQEAVIREGIK